MFNLKLSDDQEQFQKLAREFAAGEIAPVAESFDHSREFPSSIIARAWEIGLINFQIPEELGGMGLGILDSCVILEELAAGCSGIAGAFEASAIAQLPLLAAGGEGQGEAFLLPLLEKPSVAGYASQDATIYDITATRQGADYLLSGRNTALINGGQAAWYLVVAQDSSQPDSSSVFIVPADAPGLSVTGRAESFGRRSRHVCTLNMDEVRLSADNLIGAPGSAGRIIEKILPAMHLMIAAGATGVASRALHHAIEYSRQRQTFGRPIGQHQAVGFILADMAREIEAARLLIRQAALLVDKGADALDRAAAAKAFAQDVAMKVTTDAVQVFGGFGYSREYPVEKLMRDAKLYQICEQSSLEVKIAHARHLVAAR